MKRVLGLLGLAAGIVIAGCGPSNRDQCDPATVMTDPDNCGFCGNACGDNQGCVDGECVDAACEPGQVEDCYSADPSTNGVGVCHGGTRTCNTNGTWAECVGEQVPSMEVCGNGVDENCSGAADENVDLDADGFTTCDGDCNDSDPLVNPGAFETNGNTVDDDCDTVADNALTECDMTLISSSADGLDFARAMDLCQTASAAGRRWGVIDATLSKADGTGTPSPIGHAIRDGFGTGMPPEHGGAVVVLSAGVAADENDTNPAFTPGGDVDHGTEISPFPADWLAANGGTLPNAPGCPPPDTAGQCGNGGCDPEMITMHIRVPSNAKSFSMKVNFFSHEFPEWVCTQFNDMFVVLLDSTFAGTPANPADKNLAFYADPVTMEHTPVGVNLAHNNTGLFTQCRNGEGGCDGGLPFQVTSCLDESQLPGTGFETETDVCDAGQHAGGGTGWLTTSGNVVGGEVITLRIAIWDTSDHIFDSTAIIDDFEWSVDAATPGTVID